MSSRRQRSIPLGGRYRQVSLYKIWAWSVWVLKQTPGGTVSEVFVLLYVLWLYLRWLYSIELLTAGGSCVFWAETGTWFCRKIWCAPVAPQRGRVPGHCEDMAVCCVLCLGWMLNGLNWPFWEVEYSSFLAQILITCFKHEKNEAIYVWTVISPCMKYIPYCIGICWLRNLFQFGLEFDQFQLLGTPKFIW